MSMFQLTGFQRDLLYVIASLDRPSGQRITERIQETTDREVTHGRLYPNLDVLEEEGLIERGEQDRRTNYYELTEAGVQAMVERREWEESVVEF
jgi:DNA-binding PadR family transcriptional regulator